MKLTLYIESDPVPSNKPSVCPSEPYVQETSVDRDRDFVPHGPISLPLP